MNFAQLEAVNHLNGPCLVLAGAGSGKTRVITHKIGRLIQAGLEPKRLRFVHHTAAAPPSLFLLEARLGGGVGLTVEPPLLLHGPDGGETEDVRRAYFRDKEE